MQKLALAALAVALASVMAITAGPANAQRWSNRAPVEAVTGPVVGTSTWGLMRPPGFTDRYVNRFVVAPRYVNRYVAVDDVIDEPAPIVNAGPVFGRSTWGLMRPPGYTNRYVNRYVVAPRYTNVGPVVGRSTWGLMRPPGFYTNRYIAPRYVNRYNRPGYVNRYGAPIVSNESLIADDDSY